MRDLDAFLHVAVETDPFGNPERRRFAHVVQQYPQGQRQRGLTQSFEHNQRVCPDIAFRMKFGRLRRALHRRDLGQDLPQQSARVE